MNWHDIFVTRAIAEFNQGVRRSRAEYRQHPFVDMAQTEEGRHGYDCALEGCPIGLRAVEGNAERSRRSKRKRRA